MLEVEQPLKNTKSPITTPKKYDDHPYHPNIGSTPRGGLKLQQIGIDKDTVPSKQKEQIRAKTTVIKILKLHTIT